MSGAASKAALEELHEKLAKTLKSEIEKAEGSDEGKGLAAMLNVARQFLKDNNIQAATVPGSPTQTLADKVSQFPFNPNEANSTH